MTNILHETEALARHAGASYRKAKPHMIEVNERIIKRLKNHGKSPMDTEPIEAKLRTLKEMISAHRKSIKELKGRHKIK